MTLGSIPLYTVRVFSMVSPTSPSRVLAQLGIDIGTGIAVPLVVCALLGRWVDTRYQTSPFGILIGLALALMASIVRLYQLMRRAQATMQEMDIPQKK